MGYRQAAVLVSVSFFLGVLLICLNVDYRILFTPLTDSVIRDGYEFYTTFYNSPPAIKASALLHAVVLLGLVGLLGKLHHWDDSAMFFDGSSLAAYIFSLAVYLTVGIPACRTVADPIPDVDSEQDRIEALRVLSAGNTIIILLLGGVLALQAGEQWSRRLEAKIVAEATAAEKSKVAPEKKAAATAESKKDK
ncbi:Shr3 amino acid permease chaperone [Polyporus arcularius HHB13444]|uniref:Shr3 amino acid permease chaperone n=1 Tax=Polyporus arcularius HHB13444 TaxID=1314778 RepID=A0A5C3PTK1_9APHY|nr:Shr3 amino acid permease chaperone [Polyporus arcularius HHB13444]